MQATPLPSHLTLTPRTSLFTLTNTHAHLYRHQHTHTHKRTMDTHRGTSVLCSQHLNYGRFQKNG